MEMPPLPPGYRFHPTDVELTLYYLKRKLLGKKLLCNAVAEVDIYKHAPWDLPAKSSMPTGDLQWYFFCTRGRKYSVGQRANRSTEGGYWKATGKDRQVVYENRTVGMKRTLVFHAGKAPKGTRTDWVMYEYRLVQGEIPDAGVRLDDSVLCKVHKKSGPGPKIGEQYGAPFEEEEEELNDANGNASCLSPAAPHSAPGPSHGGVLNSVGQKLSHGGGDSLSVSPANNGGTSGAGPDRASCLDVNWDSIHVEQLADIIGRLSTNPVSQDGPLSDLTTANQDSETIFEITDQIVPSSLCSSLCKQCDKCGVRLVDPLLEPAAGEPYVELNDLLSRCRAAGQVADGSSSQAVVVSNGEGPVLDLELKLGVESSDSVGHSSGAVSAAASGSGAPSS
uniref:NAC family transcription factor NAC-A2 n=1 Tax=Triticum aestivum TaxID=4565 RepID=A0A6B9SL80_WHEAT|nr:NAC family transcription factor NAC-A2 [Triticum aestivum]